MSRTKKVKLLRRLLNDADVKASRKSIYKVMRNDTFGHLLTKVDERLREKYKQRYLQSDIVRNTLFEIYEEFNHPMNPRKTFGSGTFIGLQGKLNCIILTKYVIEHKLKWGIGEVLDRISYKVLYQHHLRCAKQCFDHIRDLIINAYPDKNLKLYYFKLSQRIWFDENGNINKELVKEAIIELISILTNPKGKYKLPLNTMPRWVNYKLFQKKILPYHRNLSYMLNACFKNSPIDAIIFAYPDLKLKPYYFSNAPNKYWSGEQGKKHAFEERGALHEA